MQHAESEHEGQEGRCQQDSHNHPPETQIAANPSAAGHSY
jgi:hypothetical protein